MKVAATRRHRGAVLNVEGVSRDYGHGRSKTRVLNDVTLSIAAGRTLAVIGESGAGKSTLSRIVAGLERPTSGLVEVGGQRLELRHGIRSPVQMVFQHPAEALNRFVSIGTSVAEPLRHLPRSQRRIEVARRLEQVGISAARANERPRSFSGGQLQRIVLARALAGQPKLLLCDEPTSSLDVSVQAQIINLLLKSQVDEGFACLLVTHDLAVARVLADDVLVMREGRVVELTSADAFFAGPEHEYSRALLRVATDEALYRPSDDTVISPQ